MCERAIGLLTIVVVVVVCMRFGHVTAIAVNICHFQTKNSTVLYMEFISAHPSGVALSFAADSASAAAADSVATTGGHTKGILNAFHNPMDSSKINRIFHLIHAVAKFSHLQHWAIPKRAR